jgi:hypothetical protein
MLGHGPEPKPEAEPEPDSITADSITAWFNCEHPCCISTHRPPWRYAGWAPGRPCHSLLPAAALHLPIGVIQVVRAIRVHR